MMTMSPGLSPAPAPAAHRRGRRRRSSDRRAPWRGHAGELRPATKVVVFQWPAGCRHAAARLRARPRRRAMLVAAPVSSMKTSLLGSRSSWSSTRPRAASRCGADRAQPHARTFFERQAAAVEEGPDGARARLDATLRGKPLLHLHDRHVRRQFDQSEQEGALRIELERRGWH